MGLLELLLWLLFMGSPAADDDVSSTQAPPPDSAGAHLMGHGEEPPPKP